MSNVRTLPAPDRGGRSCYRWLSPVDVIRIALGAYYTVCRGFDRYPADPQTADMLSIHGPHDLATDIGELFALRLLEHGHAAGLPAFQGYAGVSQKLASCYAPEYVEAKIRDMLCADPNMGMKPDTHRALSQTETGGL